LTLDVEEYSVGTVYFRKNAMHLYVTPPSVEERVLRRQGRPFCHETIVAERTALVVVDMQNYFVAEGFAAEVPTARKIVPNINAWQSNCARLAAR
jgi:hypothetical protein